MMKSLLAASAALVAVAGLAAPVFAADATNTVTINGTVSAVCSVNIASPITLGTIALDTDGHATTGTTATGTFGAIWCNGAHNTLSVTANPLANTQQTSTPSPGFTRVLNYTLSTNLTTDTLTSSSTPTVVNSVPAFSVASGSGSLTLQATTDKVLAGDYSGTIVIALTPGV